MNLSKVAVFIVTFRRHQMLRRAIASVTAQTHRNIVVKVVNDDPEDLVVSEIIHELADDRVTLFTPVEKRGATRNFNLVFAEKDADFVSLLEDDNWWEPEFLERQIEALSIYPDHMLVVGNERVWRERPDGSWLDTSTTIWPHRGYQTHELSLEEICGSAKLCNSSMLVRVRRDADLLTPDTIPVDVTEHFRERLLPPSLLLNGDPLVNYAETLRTARTTAGGLWGAYQCLLIGSVFVATEDRKQRKTFAAQLWRSCPSSTSPRAVSLVAAGFACREARDLVWAAPLASMARFAVWIGRRPMRLVDLFATRRRLANELAFLTAAPLTRHFAEAAS